jgi:hypothetical protein
VGLLIVGQALIHRTQRAASVEAEDLSDEAVDVDALDVPGSLFVAAGAVSEDFSELFRDAESPLSEVIDDEDAPRLSVL